MQCTIIITLLTYLLTYFSHNLQHVMWQAERVFVTEKSSFSGTRIAFGFAQAKS